MVDSQPMEEETLGMEARDVGTETHGGPTKPVLQTQKTPSPSPAFIKENIDVLRTMIKEHDQQAKTKATPRRLAYADSDKEALARSKSRGKRSGHQETSSDSEYEEGSEDAYEDLNSPYKRPKPTPFPKESLASNISRGGRDISPIIRTLYDVSISDVERTDVEEREVSASDQLSVTELRHRHGELSSTLYSAEKLRAALRAGVGCVSCLVDLAYLVGVGLWCRNKSKVLGRIFTTKEICQRPYRDSRHQGKTKQRFASFHGSVQVRKFTHKGSSSGPTYLSFYAWSWIQNSLKSSMTKYPRRWMKCSKESGLSFEEKLSRIQQKWSVPLSRTKAMSIQHGLEDPKKPEPEVLHEKHEETWGYTLLTLEKILLPHSSKLR
ncbi:hypothetical protein Tco_1406747 [Tanacetum coccineum]